MFQDSLNVAADLAVVPATDIATVPARRPPAFLLPLIGVAESLAIVSAPDFGTHEVLRQFAAECAAGKEEEKAGEVLPE